MDASLQYHSGTRFCLDARFPESAIELLNLVVNKAARDYFPALASCLGAVRAARPNLERDLQFRRANGGDPT